MAILKLAPLAFLVACYSPDVDNCVVACNTTDDCAPNQLCNASGRCAGPEVQCSASIDAGLDPTPDDSPPDAAIPLVKLTVKIDGRGDVVVVGIGTCDGGNGMTECTFDVPKNLPVTLEATPKNMWRFEKWSEDCDHQPTTTCLLTPAMPAKARARFMMSAAVL
jgi:hypothetical protein